MLVISRDLNTHRPFPSIHASTIVEDAARTLWTRLRRHQQRPGRVEIGVAQTAGRGVVRRSRSRDSRTCDVDPVLCRTREQWLLQVGQSPRIGSARPARHDGANGAPTVYLPAGQLGPIRDSRSGAEARGSRARSGGRYRRGRRPEAISVVAGWAKRDRGATGQGRAHRRANEPFGVSPTLWQCRAARFAVMRAARASAHRDVIVEGWPPHVAPARRRRCGYECGHRRGDAADQAAPVIYNHLTEGRNSIHLAVSKDWGTTWSPPMQLEAEDAQLSYPAIIQSADGLVHATYTWKRQRVRYLVIDPKKIG